MKLIQDPLLKSAGMTPPLILRSLKIICFAQILGILIFTVVSFYLSGSDRTFRFNIEEDPLLVIAFIMMISIPAGYYISKASWNKIASDDSLTDKMVGYQSGFIIRLAMCEGVGLFSVVGFLLSGNMMYTLVALVAILFIVSNYPIPEKIRSDINLTESELTQLIETG